MERDLTGSEDYPPRYWYNQKRRTDSTLNMPHEPKPTPRAEGETGVMSSRKNRHRDSALILAVIGAVTGLIALGLALASLFIR